MARVIPLRLILIAIATQELPAAQEPAQPFRILADFKHVAKFTEPGKSSAIASDEFGIAVPLPARLVERNRLPDNSKSRNRIIEKLGRIRIEMAPKSDLVVSIDHKSDCQLLLFQRSRGDWQRLPPDRDRSWTATPAPDGTAEIGVGVVLPEASPNHDQPTWPRAFDVLVSSKAKPGQSVRVPFRVAPFIIPSALEPVEDLLIVALPVTEDTVRSLQAFASVSGVKLVVHEAKEPSDQWMQDTIQPGLFAFPAATGTAQARASLLGLRKASRPSAARLDYHVARWLRREGVVTISAGTPRERTRWIDGFGNLESTPPHTDRHGRLFPYGRLIVGRQKELSIHPEVMAFLKSQGMQWPPIVVDTSWLAIGHVDELVNFVPAKNAAGFKVLLPSPLAAREMLEKLAAKGLEATPVFEGTESEMTLGELRTTIARAPENLAIDRAVSRLRGQLKTELNLDDSDFVMLPALFQSGIAVIPNPVNSMMVNDSLLVAEPLGPLQNGKDGFEDAIVAALADCNVRVVFIDCWDSYHTSAGEIHCGTNTFRRLRDPAWWKHKLGDDPEKRGE